MITGVCGEPGMGKGIYSMFLLHHLVMQGKRVFTNIRLRPECPFEHLVHILDDDEGKFPVYDEDSEAAWWDFVPRESAVVIDEGDNYFDCTDHSKIAKRCRIHHKQHRKYHQDVFYIVQNPANLYVRIRRMMSRWVLCEWSWRTEPMLQRVASFFPSRTWFNFVRRLSRYQRIEFSGYPFNPKNQCGWGHITYQQATEYFSWYDTEQIIGEPTYARDGKNSHEDESGVYPAIRGDDCADQATSFQNVVVVNRRRRRVPSVALVQSACGDIASITGAESASECADSRAFAESIVAECSGEVA